MSYYSQVELKAMAFSELGDDVYISRKASIYGAENIVIGNNVRIDDFCILSAGVGGIAIGHNIHIACFSSIIGAEKITLHDFCNISARVSIYSSSDDYSGEFLTNPTVTKKYTNVEHSPVFIGKHVVVGCGSVILPGVNIEEGCAIGALTLVNKSLAAWGVYVGQPAKLVKQRANNLLKLEEEFVRFRQHNLIKSQL